METKVKTKINSEDLSMHYPKLRWFQVEGTCCYKGGAFFGDYEYIKYKPTLQYYDDGMKEWLNIPTEHFYPREEKDN